MTIQTKTAHPVTGMSYEHSVNFTSEDPADRVSLKALLNTLQTTPDYFTEEKPVFGLTRIGSELRRNLRGAN